MKKSDKDITVKTIMFEVTQNCNCSCKFCYNCSGNSEENIDMELFRQIMKSLKIMKVNRIAISGGEPFLYPNLHEMLNETISNGMNATVLSNGLYIDDKCLELLIQNDNLSLQLSLDSIDEEINDGMRIKGHYKKCNKIMNILSDNGFKNGYVRMTITRKNSFGFSDFFELCKKYQFVPTFSFVRNTGRATTSWEEHVLSEDEKKEIVRKLAELYEKHKNWICQRISKEEFKRITQFYTGYCSLIKSQLVSSPLVKVNGDVQICQRLYGQEFCIGNLKEQKLEDIISLNNPKMAELIELARQRYLALSSGICKKCVINEGCGKGCMADSADKEDMLGMPDDCAIHKEVLLNKLVHTI